MYLAENNWVVALKISTVATKREELFPNNHQSQNNESVQLWIRKAIEEEYL